MFLVLVQVLTLDWLPLFEFLKRSHLGPVRLNALHSSGTVVCPLPACGCVHSCDACVCVCGSMNMCTRAWLFLFKHVEHNPG